MHDRSREILQLKGDELETFYRTWIGFHAAEAGYVRVEKFSGAHDLGRDVVGFLTDDLHEGPWDNYQCKQLKGRLNAGQLFEEIGKVLWHASRRAYLPPRRYVFVAPNDGDRSVQDFVYNPSKMRAELLGNWDRRCAGRISDGQVIEMTPELKAVIESYEFSRVELMNISAIMSTPGMAPTLSVHFGDDPGEAPPGEVPGELLPEERKYVGQLIELYGETEGAPFDDDEAVLRHPRHGGHLQMQRERYFDGVAFRSRFRDPLFEKHVAHVEREVRSGVFEAFEGNTGLARVNEVMKAAGAYSPSGLFARYGRLSLTVRQGTCHHLANRIESLAWTRK